VTYTAADTGGSGLGSVELWVKAPGQSTFANVATDASPGATGSFTYTAASGEGTYSFYTRAVDRAGNREVAPTAADSTTVLDTTSPKAFQMTNPGTYLRGTITLKLSSAPTDPGSGIASVRYQYAPAGTSTWSQACAATQANWSCSFDTTTIADGSYLVRAIATDKAGNPPTVASNTPVTRPVDNTAPVARTLNTTNAAKAAAGVPTKGDTVTFSYSETMSSTSMLSDWTGGASTRVQVMFFDDPSGDLLEVWNAAGTTRVALAKPLSLGGDYVPAGGAVFGSASATGVAASTIARSGVDVKVTLGALSRGSVQTRAVTGGTLAWTPDTVATDLAGNAALATPVARAGPAF
jgi:hypothetical protein